MNKLIYDYQIMKVFYCFIQNIGREFLEIKFVVWCIVENKLDQCVDVFEYFKFYKIEIEIKSCVM